MSPGQGKSLKLHDFRPEASLCCALFGVESPRSALSLWLQGEYIGIECTLALEFDSS